MDKEFEDEYADEIEGLRETIKLTVKAIEILWEELQKSNLPEEIKKTLLLNYKMKGE